MRGVFHPQFASHVAAVINDAMTAQVSIYRVTGQGSFDFVGNGGQVGATQVLWTPTPIQARIQKMLRPRHGVVAHASYDRQEIRIQIPITTTPPSGEIWQSGIVVKVVACGKDAGMVGRAYSVISWEGSATSPVRTLVCESNEKER